jgi:hypothetical protein
MAVREKPRKFFSLLRSFPNDEEKKRGYALKRNAAKM